MKKILGRRDFLLTPNKTKNEVASLLIKPTDLKKNTLILWHRFIGLAKKIKKRPSW
jgi:hypothetical protein